MCEYCGCQSLDTIDQLTREHDLVVDLIAQAHAAHATGDRDGLAAVARGITAVLGPHTAVEERGLFPAMATDFPDHVAALEAEHRQIETVLGEAAAATPGEPTWPERLMATLAMLRDHILKEQDGMFPAALSTLTPEDWDAVEAVRAGVGTLLPSSPRRG